MEEAVDEAGDGDGIDGEPFDLAAFSVLQPSGVNSEFSPLTVSFVTRAGENRSASIIVIASHRGRYLVALPSEVWHRTAARRVLVEGSLVRASLAGLIASEPADRSVVVPELEIKAWVGYASENLLSNLAEYDPDNADFTFIRGDPQCLPAASALEQVARSQFGVQLTGETAEALPPVVEARLEKLETDFSSVRASVEQLTLAVQQSLPQQGRRVPLSSGFVRAEEDADEFGFPKARGGYTGAPPGLSPPPHAGRTSTAKEASKLASRLGLDPTVVASAIQSGVSIEQLETIGKLVQEKPQRLEDLPRKNQARKNPLSESEAEEEPLEVQPELPADIDPVAAALTQLTRIVSKLADPKKKEPSLEDMLDGVGTAGSSSHDSSVQFSSRRSAAALKALRKALISSPKQIWQSIEQNMEEDFHQRAAAPGTGQQQMTARGWAQYRSRIQNYPQ